MKYYTVVPIHIQEPTRLHGALKYVRAIELIKARLLPARASEQGNVIGLVSVYIYMCVIKK